MLLRIHQNNFIKLLQRISIGNRTVHIFEGPIPNVTKDFTFALADYESKRLATVTMSTTYAGNPPTMLMNGSSPTFSPIKAGVAAWFAIMGNSPAETVIGTVTNNSASNDPMLLSALNLEQGVQASIIDFKVAFGV
jgi:hypothetical protein